jgi:hypothetical protein
MKKPSKSTDKPSEGKMSGSQTGLERELTKALDQSSADLSEQFEEIARKYRKRAKVTVMLDAQA